MTKEEILKELKEIREMNWGLWEIYRDFLGTGPRWPYQVKIRAMYDHRVRVLDYLMEAIKNDRRIS